MNDRRRSVARMVARAALTVTGATRRSFAAIQPSTRRLSTSPGHSRSSAKPMSVLSAQTIRSVRHREPLAADSIPADTDAALIHMRVDKITTNRPMIYENSQWHE